MLSLRFLQNFLSPLPISTPGIASTAATTSAVASNSHFIQFQLNNPQNFTTKPLTAVSGNSSAISDQPSVVLDSLRVLQWDQLCDCVASFSGTSIGKRATKEQLWNLDKAYSDSVKLLEETNAAVEMQKYGAMMDFTSIDIDLVETSIKCARRGFPVSGQEAIALAALLQFAESLQLNVKAAIKEDSDWFGKFMPLSEMIMEIIISQPLVKLIEQLVDEDGSVKDSASSNLRHARDQVRLLERKLYQLMESMVRNERNEAGTLEICNIDGRWCIKSGTRVRPNFEGLLLASGSGAGSLVEPLSAVPLNDELQQARSSVVKAEEEVLLKITKKMQVELNDIESVFNSMIQIDIINARARYSLSFEGVYPDLYLPKYTDSTSSAEILPEDTNSLVSQLNRKKWTLYLPKAHHPLLFQQHRQNLQMAMKDLSNANAEIRRRRQLGGYAKRKEEKSLDVSSLEMQVAKLKQALPVPFDIFIAQNTRVLVITGPNTGGKTICLKTLGLAAMMAKSGLYVLASEPARIPWFDFVLADIGDEQSLSQSLSTFSGHLKQISAIKCLATSLSLVLLDEVGAGTNPLEGAALGMSLLESFADAVLLTIATTHHGELKALKYSNNAFENACMEFDEVNLKPTYRILWGVPGRSNAINIAERLGLPAEILDNARELYGAASAEINEVIVDMERFKQEYHEKVRESQHYQRLSEKLHQSLLLTRERITEHEMEERYRMMQEISKASASARSIIHQKVRESRTLPTQPSKQLKQVKADTNRHASEVIHNQAIIEKNKTSATTETSRSVDNTKKAIIEKQQLELPKVGDTVNVPSLNMKAKVVTLDLSKGEIVVQAGLMKMKLKLADILT